RATGPATLGEMVGIALEHLDLLEGNAKLVGDDLREGGGVALALGQRTEEDLGRAVGADLDAAVLRGAARGRFHVDRHADAAPQLRTRRRLRRAAASLPGVSTRDQLASFSPSSMLRAKSPESIE